jgi:glycosyltransferase involved in cell wall biosynthesis
VPALCNALARAGVNLEIVSHHYGTDVGEPNLSSSDNFAVTFVECSSILARKLQWTSQFKAKLYQRCIDFQPRLLHDTGLWLSTNHSAAAISSKLGVPRIVSPRGMLTSWALQHKGLKKRVAWALYQHRDLETAHLLHATSKDEAQGIRALGLRQPIAVIPNGVEPPPPQRSQFSTPNSPIRTLLFLSRLHPKKGLLNLVRAWASAKIAGWRVVIAGNDEGGHVNDIRAESRKLKVEGDFEFVGAVEGTAKWDLYRTADLFVLPSHSENFGLAVAEALVCGVPVITTRGTPWEDLVTHRCGWWTEIGTDPLAAALREATALTDTERKEMGVRGRQLVERDFSWTRIAEEMREVYCWLTEGGSKPQCVLQAA